MAEPRFSNVADIDADDDLPRTLRREREAQARRAREQDHGEVPAPQASPIQQDAPPPHFEPQSHDYEDDPPATVTRLDIPFFHLMTFCLKAVIAGIPALLLLLVILWGLGEIVQATFPELVKMELLIRMPK